MEYNIQHLRQRHLNQPTHRFLTVKFYLAIVLILTLLTANVLGSTLGSKCQHDMDCTDFIKGSSCSAQGYCECAPYFVQFNTSTCLSSQLLGGDCTLNEQCTMKVSNSSCLDGACRCVEGFLQFRKHTCLGPASPGSVCYSHAHCQIHSTLTHCNFLIPNLFGHCQCTAPAKLKNGICVDNTKVDITTEAVVELSKISTSSTTTTTITTTTTPAPVKETQAPAVQIEEVFAPQQIAAGPIAEEHIEVQHPTFANPIQKEPNAEGNENFSVEEQEWEDDKETEIDVKIESSTQQMPLTPAQIPELQMPVVVATENVENQDIPNVTDDYPYKIEEEYNEESAAVPQEIEDEHKKDEIVQEEQPSEQYGDALDNTMNFDYGTAQHEMEQELEEEQNLIKQESDLEQAHVAEDELINDQENIKEQEHIIEHESILEPEVDAVPEIEETIIVPTDPASAEIEESSSDSLISQMLTNEIHHNHLAEDEVVSESESVQNENESTAQQQQPEAVLVNDEVITTQPAVAEVTEKKVDDEVENNSHKIQKQQPDVNDKKTENNEVENLANHQIEENSTEGHVPDIGIEQQAQHEILDETTVKMPEADDAALQVIQDLEKQEDHIDILTKQPEKINQNNPATDNMEQQRPEEIYEVAPDEEHYDQPKEENMEEHITFANTPENISEVEEVKEHVMHEETQLLDNESENEFTDLPQYLSENVDEQQEDHNRVEEVTEFNIDDQEQHEEPIAIQEQKPLKHHEESIALQVDEQENPQHHEESIVVQDHIQEPIEQHEQSIAVQDGQETLQQHEESTSVQNNEQEPIQQHDETITVQEHEQEPLQQQEESTPVQDSEKKPLQQYDESIALQEDLQEPIEQEPHEEQVANDLILVDNKPIIFDVEQQQSQKEEAEKKNQKLEEVANENVEEPKQEAFEPVSQTQNENINAENDNVKADEDYLEEQHKQDTEDIMPQNIENEDTHSLVHNENVHVSETEDINHENSHHGEESDNLEQISIADINGEPEQENKLDAPVNTSEINNITDHEELFEESTQIANKVDALREEENDSLNHLENSEAYHHIQNIESEQHDHQIVDEQEQEKSKDETQNVENYQDQEESESQIMDVQYNHEDDIANEANPEYIEDHQSQTVDEKEQNKLKEDTQHEENIQDQEESESQIMDVQNNHEDDLVNVEETESTTEGIAHDLQSEIDQHSDTTNDENIEDNEISETEQYETEQDIESVDQELATDVQSVANQQTDIPLEDNVTAETEHQETEQHGEAQQIPPEHDNIVNSEVLHTEKSEIVNENYDNETENVHVIEDQQVVDQDLDGLESEEFKESESISDILNDLMKEEVTVQPDIFDEMQNNFNANQNQQQGEVPDLIAEDSNISEEKIISQQIPAQEGTEGPIDPEDKLITFYPDMEEMHKQQQHHQIVDTHSETEEESSGDEKPNSLENEIIDHSDSAPEQEHRTLSPLELPFDTSVEYQPQELAADNLVVETTTISSSEIKGEQNEQAEATTTPGDIAELTTQTMLNLASRVTLMEPAAPVATTLKPLMSGNTHDEVTAVPSIDAPIPEVFLTTKPTTEIRKRVELSLEAVSLGLTCSTDKQCQLADPHTVCNTRGVCDCAASTYAHSAAGQCGAERTGCAPGTFQCRSSGVCISWFFVCDGRSDCNDASDEECTFNTRLNQTCPSQAFQCAQSGRCISRAALCDGRKQCPHGEDEIGCNGLKSEQSCPPHTFRCKSGECLPEYEYCNAIISCRDGSDEPPHLCGSRSIPNFFLQLLTAGGIMNKNIATNAYCPHRCSNDRCRSTAIVCSGRDGCGDGTDEQTCSVCRCPAVIMNKPVINVSDFLARHRPMPLW